MSDDVKGLRSPFASTSAVNSQDYQIKQYLRGVYTNFVGIVQDCASDEENEGAKTVTILPAVMQIDGENNSLPMTPIPKCPHYRVQQGICALVIDPVPGDIAVMNALKADSTNVQQGTTTPQRPGSLSEFSQSNAIMTGAIHTKKPENWITLRQDKTRESYAPEGVLNRTDKTIREEMGENHEWEIGQNATHNIGQDVTITIGQNCQITIGADKTITITGNFTGTVSGNADLTVSGNVNVNIQGNAQVTVGGSTTLTSSGNLTMSAPQIVLDAPETTITGNLNQGGGGRSRAGAFAEFAGTIHAAGTITSDSDVISAGISGKSHTHGGVEPGSGNTGAPA